MKLKQQGLRWLKVVTDVAAMICLLVAFVTGMKLHSDVHHAYSSNQGLIYDLHVIAGFLTAISILLHCIQHKYWFVNYRRIPALKKRITAILLSVAIVVVITGLILVSSHNAPETSISHYVTGIIFFFMVIGHVIKRWNMFKKLFLLNR